MPDDILSKIAGLRTYALGAGFLSVLALPAVAGTLPAPYVSRALSAVLIPVDASVQTAFGLATDEKGVLVLAVAPGGVAEGAGIEPGDVIDKAYGQVITDPIKLDEIVYYWINKGTYDFGFDAWHGGAAKYYTTTITLESYSTVIDLTTVSSWSSYSYEGFSYAEYTTEYSSEMSESYESAEASIEETTSSEEFAAEETADESAVDPNLDTDGDGTPDVSDTDDDNDGTPDMSDADENGDGTADAEE